MEKAGYSVSCSLAEELVSFLVVAGVVVLFLIRCVGLINPVNILVRGFRSRTRRKCDAAVMPVFMEAGVGDSSPVLATASTSRAFTVARGWAFPGNGGGESFLCVLRQMYIITPWDTKAL